MALLLSYLGEKSGKKRQLLPKAFSWEKEI
jgi:recombinational DNA repair protein (RecF pathway)